MGAELSPDRIVDPPATPGGARIVLASSALVVAGAVVGLALTGSDAGLRVALGECAAVGTLLGVLGFQLRERGYQALSERLAATVEHRAQDVQAAKALADRVEIRQSLLRETVGGAFFYLRSNGRIDDDYAPKLEQLLAHSHLAETRLVDILQPRLTERTYATISDYVEMLFDTSHKHRALDQVNPMRQLPLNFPSDNGLYEQRFLRFTFRRCYERDTIAAVFVLVDDVTDVVRLETRLQEADERRDRMFQFLVEIVNVDDAALDDFLAVAREHVARLNATLRTQDFSVAKSGQTAIFRTRLEAVFRSVDEIKKRATATNLSYWEKTCLEFEQKLVLLRSRQELAGDDLLTVLIHQSALERDLSDMLEVRERVAAAKRGGRFTAPVAGAREDEVVTAAAQAAASAAEASGKKVKLETLAFDTRGLTPELVAAVRGVVTEFVRNAVQHGIESPEERRQTGKPEIATITLGGRSDPAAGTFICSVRDDGHGLDTDAIRAVAVRRGVADAEQLTSQALAPLIFGRGFTTIDESSTEALRGFGLAIVRETVINKHAGSLSLSTEPLAFTEFTASLPLKPRKIADFDSLTRVSAAR